MTIPDVNDVNDVNDINDINVISKPSVLKDIAMAGLGLHELYNAVDKSENGFEVAGDRDSDGDIETIWRFMSVHEIAERQHAYSKMLDVATMYQGMGWCKVLSYIPKTDMFCVRMDGGSSDHDRLNCFGTYSDDSYRPTEFPVFDRFNDFDKFGEFDLQNGVQYPLAALLLIISPSFFARMTSCVNELHKNQL